MKVLTPSDLASAKERDEAPTIVAIGASAGGLDPLKEFFAATVANTRFAFVVLTHLPAQHVSHLPELLGRAGTLRVSQALDGEKLVGGQVYTNPPGSMMGIRRGIISLEARPSGPPARKPIDYFMAALAEDAGDRAVGIVLSGTDHDGSVGLKAIKAAGGLTLVQSPGTAQFPSMPESAIDTGTADKVLAPKDMPAALYAYFDHVPLDLGEETKSAEAVANDVGSQGLREVLAVILTRTGHDFRWYRPGMLRRRLRRRMGLRGLDHVADYLAVLEKSDDEVTALKSEFLIGVTDFFRDPEAWQALSRDVLPKLLDGRNAGDLPIRVWTPGCATGEESYSIAMLLLEQFDHQDPAHCVQVFGTDIDTEALNVARRGSYPLSIDSTVGVERLARFFDRRGDRYVVRKSLRDTVVFAPQSLVRDTPFSRLDLVLCRNLLIYFQPGLQERVLQLFHFALKPAGFLLLGKAESVGAQAALFEPASQAARLFRRIGGRSHLPRGFVGEVSEAELVVGVRPQGAARTNSSREIVRGLVAKRDVTAAVLVDRDGRALHFHGQTGHFLAPQGDATLELSALLRHELRAALRSVQRQLAADKRPALEHAAMKSEARMQRVRVEVEPVDHPTNRGLALVMLTLVPPEGTASATEPATVSAIHPMAESEIEESRRILSLALEDAERSNEDLRIANEESLALNEELQSSNEELESSKEELQSLNEELATVNAQLEDKIGEVARGHDDLSNLLASTDIATVLLDKGLRVRRFTPAAAELFSLRPGDEGRLLADISSRVEDPDFAADLGRVLASLQPAEAEVRTPAGLWFLRRILPYRPGESDLEGVVATFVDITPLRAAGQQTRHLLAALEDSNDAVIAYRPDGTILSWNSGAEAVYGYARDDAVNLGLFGLIPASARKAGRDLIELVHVAGRAGPLDAERVSKAGRTIGVSVTATALRDEKGLLYAVLSTERDLTEQMRFESEVHFRRLADDIPALLRVEDPSGHARFVNRACADFTGQQWGALLGDGWRQFLHPEDRPRYLADYAAALPERAGFETDFRLLRHDGVYRWMRSISVPHTDAAGVYTGYVALTLDVQDRKQAEAELVAADRRKDEYLAMLAHELRNPLAPIRNAAGLLAGMPQPDPKATWATGIIQRQTDVMAKLLDDILDVARIARGKVSLTPLPVDMVVLVERAVEIARPMIDARQHELLLDLPDAPLTVVGDLLRLTQVLANLLNNAAKYTDDKGQIRVQVRQEDREAVIRVSDNGAGISAEMIPHVFDLFAQADTTLDRAKGGLGLGLTLVRQLVKLHGGSVEAHSEGLGHGSTFVVRLPLLDQAPAPGRQDGIAAQTPAGTGGLRILVVDDNVDAAQSLAAVLGLCGHQVTVVHDARKVVAVAEASRPDAVILDIGLPHINGYQLARNLRGRAKTAKTVLIALTGYGQPEDVERARAAGFDHHLVKPADPSTVDSILTAQVSASDRE